jgi:hypothetical protein
MVELELLAICWAAKKCASFIDGLPLKIFEIWTDHAPLIPILNKYTLPEIETSSKAQSQIGPLAVPRSVDQGERQHQSPRLVKDSISQSREGGHR